MRQNTCSAAIDDSCTIHKIHVSPRLKFPSGIYLVRDPMSFFGREYESGARTMGGLHRNQNV